MMDKCRDSRQLSVERANLRLPGSSLYITIRNTAVVVSFYETPQHVPLIASQFRRR